MVKCALRRAGAVVGAIAAAGFVPLTLNGCEREGPAEKTGREVDKAAKKAGENIEQAGKDIQRSTK
jgi:hypothetical protein